MSAQCRLEDRGRLGKARKHMASRIAVAIIITSLKCTSPVSCKPALSTLYLLFELTYLQINLLKTDREICTLSHLQREKKCNIGWNPEKLVACTCLT